jgi:glutathione S-transferase
MEVGFAELVNKQDTPHLVRWIEQINARPRDLAMLASLPTERLGPPKAD